MTAARLDGAGWWNRLTRIIIPLLVGVAYLTYAERKVLAAMQLRQGPNLVGPFGLLQPSLRTDCS